MREGESDVQQRGSKEQSCGSQTGSMTEAERGGEQIFSCYCGENFITSTSFAKHQALHANGLWEPEPDEEEGERGDAYLKLKCRASSASMDLERQMERDARAVNPAMNVLRQVHPVKVETRSIASSRTSNATFWTAQTHQGSL